MKYKQIRTILASDCRSAEGRDRLLALLEKYLIGSKKSSLFQEPPAGGVTKTSYKKNCQKNLQQFLSFARQTLCTNISELNTFVNDRCKR